MAFHSAVDSGITVNRFSEDLRLIDMELPTAAFGVSSSMYLSKLQDARMALNQIIF